jgi:hypothetical protein
MAGIDFLRELRDGRLLAPPINHAINHAIDFALDEVEPGRAVFSLSPGEEHYNPIGSVHDGIFATLLNPAAGCAVQSLLPQGMVYTSLHRPDGEVSSADHPGHGHGPCHRHGCQQGASNRPRPGVVGRRDGPAARPRHQ